MSRVPGIKVVDKRLLGWFAVDNHIFSKDNKIGPYALLVYCVLCRIATSKEEEAVTSRAYIAKLARISTGSVSKGVQELVDAGLITVESQRDGGKNLPSKYTINSPERPSSGDGGRPSPDDRHPMTVMTDTSSKDLLEVKELSEVKTNTPAAKAAEPVFDADAMIVKAFEYYCKKFERSPTQYSLTDNRRKKAILRFRERENIVGTDQARREIRFAIDNLAASDYHVTNGYIDWVDQIFKSAEEFEKRVNWQPPTQKGQKNEQHTAIFDRNNAGLHGWLENAINRDTEKTADSELPPRSRPLLGTAGG